MAESKRCRVPFGLAWALAVRPGRPIVMVTHPAPPAGAILWPTDRNDRITWRVAIEATRDGWRRAFDGFEATDGERALLLLSPALEALGEPVELDDYRAGIAQQGAIPSAA